MKLFLQISFLLSAHILGGNSDIKTRTYVGHAYDRNTQKGLYNEYHEESFQGSKHISSSTQYKNLNGTLIASRKLNFSKGQQNPDYRLDVSKNGYYEGAEMVNGQVKVYNYNLSDKKQHSKMLNVSAPVVIDGGLSYFIKNNFTAIAQGKVVTFNFVVPARLDYYHFRVRKLANVKEGGLSGIKVVIEPDNFLLRSVVDPIEITYDLVTKRIIKYVGISNIPGNGDRNFDIMLDYPDLGA